jgi:hypothetical protein
VFEEKKSSRVAPRSPIAKDPAPAPIDSIEMDEEQEAFEKETALEEIESLRETLASDGVDVSRIETVSAGDSLEKIARVRRKLVAKDNTARATTFMEEIILLGVYQLEDTFDGKTEWFGHYKPDLTGWSDTVKIKLKRMRPETAGIVNKIMRDYQITGITRVLMEIIPSMFMHTRNNRSVQATTTLVSDKEYTDALQRL